LLDLEPALSTSVADDGHEVEADLLCALGLVSLDALLDDRPDQRQPRLARARADCDRSTGEAVQLVDDVLEGHVRDKVEGVLGLARCHFVHRHGLCTGKAVVHRTHQFTVGDGLALEVRGEVARKLLELAQFGSEVDVALARVHEHPQDGLRGAGVLDQL